MTVADHKPPTIDPVVESLLAFDPKTGAPSKHLVELLRQLRDYNLGGNRMVPCDAGGSANAITLTPNNPISPIMEAYADHDGFIFTASANSSSTVTAEVITRDGSLGVVKLYKTHGSAQANNGDLISGLLYVAYYDSAADSGAGGLIML